MRTPYALGALLGLAMLAGCTEEQQNRLARLEVTWLEGDYKVTSAFLDGH